MLRECNVCVTVGGMGFIPEHLLMMMMMMMMMNVCGVCVGGILLAASCGHI